MSTHALMPSPPICPVFPDHAPAALGDCQAPHLALSGQSPRNVLQALTASALLLSGFAPPTVHAADGDEDSATLQFSHYREGKRDLSGTPNSLQPIQVDSLRGAWQFELSERSHLTLHVTQDTWSGATPIATAPLVARGNRAIPQGGAGTMSGASPYLNGPVLLDRQLTPLQQDPGTRQVIGPNPQVVHTMSSASPETRREVELKGQHAWDEARLTLGGGISQERDYESRFVNARTQWDFNQKLTQLSLGASYAQGKTSATLDPDAAPYITKTAYQNQITSTGSQQVLHGDRRDHGLQFGLTQVLTADALLEASLGFTRSSGYLANPYRVMSVIFVEPPAVGNNPATLNGNMQALLEQRPDSRQQWMFSTRYAQFFPAADAGLHLGYRYFRDDWAIKSHTVEAEWRQALANQWSLTPSLRYYSQSAARFYQPYLVSPQAFRKIAIDANENVTITPYNPQLLPRDFSSDPRLSGFGSLSGGLTLARQFGKGLRFEVGVEFYQHEGGLELGGGGEGAYADYHALSAHAALSLSLDNPLPGDPVPTQHHSHHAAIPAGVMAGHLLNRAGDMMLGYRFMHSRDGSEKLLRGARPASDAEVLQQGCAPQLCYSVPRRMTMRMHMLELMFAPTDHLTLMLMPQFVDMQMDVRGLPGAPLPPAGSHVHNAEHSTGGLGDTSVYALLGLVDTPGQQLHVGLGLSIPTGEVGLTFRRSHQLDPGLLDYGMQLGSGTWDLKPSLTFTGQQGRWGWGGQINATLRVQNENKSGYALGDMAQITAWGSYGLNDALAVTLRGVYTALGAIRGTFKEAHPQTGTMDFAGNYGGRYGDVGLGLNAVLGEGGQHLSLEWLQPVSTRVKGYQLDRRGALALAWGYVF